ncbi:MAG: DoxX family protein [Ferruginibacter sp.]
MKKLLSIKYSAAAFNAALLILRLGSGILIMHHGYDKLVNFSSMSADFKIHFLGLGSGISLGLVVFAEFFCGLFIVLGLFTRLVTIPLIINMSFALFKAHQADVFGKGELSALFLTTFIVILLLGPGKVSVDGMTGK